MKITQKFMSSKNQVEKAGEDHMATTDKAAIFITPAASEEAW
jgi:hypothetical protein